MNIILDLDNTIINALDEDDYQRIHLAGVGGEKKDLENNFMEREFREILEEKGFVSSNDYVRLFEWEDIPSFTDLKEELDNLLLV
jgi:hypothetical protein